jgi:adenosylmethionine-8-amino-7-oxononanoate aminotransferase
VGRRKAYHAYLEKCPQIDTPFCFHCPYEKEYPACNLYCARELEKVIGRVGADNISAFITEPIIGASGAGITPPEEYFPLIQDICRRHHILFIMDEVITGFGRTGKNFACNHWQVEPDIIVFGKGVSAGYGPLAGIIVSDTVCRAIQEGSGEFTTGHTFGGNPLCCAAGCSVLDYMEKHHIIQQVGDKGRYLTEQLRELQKKTPLIADVRGKGLLLGIELMKDWETKTLFDPEEKVTDRLVEACFQNGLIVYPSSRFLHGMRGDSLLISPPLTITYDEMDELVGVLGVTFTSFIT